MASNPKPHAKLEFTWYEIDPSEEKGLYWGQLAGGTHRLYFVADELEAVGRIRDTKLALDRLAYHLENYLVRAYELRERALSLLLILLVSGRRQQKKMSNKLRDPEQRGQAFEELKKRDKARGVVNAFIHLQQILEEDISLRNLHTHHQFLGLSFHYGTSLLDPWNLLEQAGSDEKRVKLLLRKVMRAMASKYCEKVRKLWDVTWDFLKEADRMKDFPQAD